MPKRRNHTNEQVKATKYTTDKAKRFLSEYGYTVPEDFEYHNKTEKIKGLIDVYTGKKVNLSISQIEYRTFKATNKRPKYTKPDELNDVMNIDFQPGRIQLSHDDRKQMYDFINDIQPQPAAHTQRSQDERLFKNIPEVFDYINYYIPTNEREDVINRIKRLVPSLIKEIKQTIRRVKPNDKQPTTLIEPINSTGTIDQESIKNALLLVLKMMKNDLLRINCKITLTSTHNTQKQFYFNENSLDLLEATLFRHDIPNPQDSNEEIINMYFINDLASIMFEFAPLKDDGKKNAGFFPFINISTIDLSDFGIYGKDDERRYEFYFYCSRY